MYINYSNITLHNHTSSNKIDEIIIIKHNIKKSLGHTKNSKSNGFVFRPSYTIFLVR